MQKKLLSVAAAAAGLLVLATAAAETDERVAEGRAIAQSFGAELRAVLQEAMTEGGPLAAISVCHEDAPRIAAEAAKLAGAEVGRTSTRLRNPGNAPDAQQRMVLASFAERVADGKIDPPPEHFELLPDGRQRYMSAIILQAPCLVCHGGDLAPAVAEAIDERYPEDAARGYSVGELRGAFTITWPATD